ncbi:DUF559 domain-containing protein [Sphingomonas sp. BGYR3]|uniref:endonuclease domain-containing protein n=1 Tax=Sphingomonas sp. BGYR3 TaxID=2975483 RepID=UPI0021A96D3F|nr:DUF559 domain-containing protein [Sphingomonas sp. BGYR3]MDG5489617.1 DUF559 domain-containing protein [Sphingomonas sp. BGYR3]
MIAQPINPSPLAGEGGARAEGVGGRGGLLVRARQLRRDSTDAERKLWSILRAKKLAGWKWRRQQPIERYIADFVCFETRVIVEADGGQHAGDPGDDMRDAWLTGQGFRVIRFWSNDILTNSEGVADRILAAQVDAAASTDVLVARPPLPNPSPARGEGLSMEHNRG